MTKPILVTSQQEWDRLAPVLEKQGYVIMHHDCIPTQHDPFKGETHPIVVCKVGRFISYDWFNSAEHRDTTQSVDEYLSSVEPKKNIDELLGTVSRDEWVDANKDYKAKYEKLLQGVKDAKDEIEAKRKQAESSEEISIQEFEGHLVDKYTGEVDGLKYVLEILTEKTGV